MKFKMVYSFLNSDINVIEKELEETMDTQAPLLRQASLHLLKAGGKEFAQFLFYLQGGSVTMILT